MVTIKSPREIELMRESCRITAMAHKEAEKHLKPGINTKRIDEVIEKVIRENGGTSSFKGYPSALKGVRSFSCHGMYIYK